MSIKILLDVFSVFIRLLSEGDGGVDPEVLVEEGAGRQPQPVPRVQSPVSVQQEPLEHLETNISRTNSWTQENISRTNSWTQGNIRRTNSWTVA